jgi:hypothetical protein
MQRDRFDADKILARGHILRDSERDVRFLWRAVRLRRRGRMQADVR